MMRRTSRGEQSRHLRQIVESAASPPVATPLRLPSTRAAHAHTQTRPNPQTLISLHRELGVRGSTGPHAAAGCGARRGAGRGAWSRHTEGDYTHVKVPTLGVGLNLRHALKYRVTQPQRDRTEKKKYEESFLLLVFLRYRRYTRVPGCRRYPVLWFRGNPGTG